MNPWLEYTRAPVAVRVRASVVTRHSSGHGDIVRVFFLLESRRGNGTKLFTSLKHNPVGIRRDTFYFLHVQRAHNFNNNLNGKPLEVYYMAFYTLIMNYYHIKRSPATECLCST